MFGVLVMVDKDRAGAKSSDCHRQQWSLFAKSRGHETGNRQTRVTKARKRTPAGAGWVRKAAGREAAGNWKLRSVTCRKSSLRMGCWAGWRCPDDIPGRDKASIRPADTTLSSLEKCRLRSATKALTAKPGAIIKDGGRGRPRWRAGGQGWGVG